jgi:hypothetical protein
MAPWPSDAQIEQDLILSRALVEMFSRSVVAQAFAFRGGSALHKLFLKRAGRYSEDIDLVQVDQGAIGPALDSIRTAKLNDPAFLEDITPLLPAGVAYHPTIAGFLIQKRLIDRLRGEPWKGRSKKNAK